jgi:hypothetical protein
MAAVAQTFLFNADAEGVSSYYGGDFEAAFLRALSTVDPIGITKSTVFLSAVIVHSLCERVTAVPMSHDDQALQWVRTQTYTV